VPFCPAEQKPFAPSGKSGSHFRASGPMRGALRDRHERWVGDAMDVSASL
jgi:hypothetical protein